MIPIWTKAIKFGRPDTVQDDAVYRYLRARIAVLIKKYPAEVDCMPLQDAGDLIAFDVFTRMNDVG
jgi:hypothetical protein